MRTARDSRAILRGTAATERSCRSQGVSSAGHDRRLPLRRRAARALHIASGLERSAGQGGVRTVAACGEYDLRERLDWAISQTTVNIALLDPQMRQLRLSRSMARVLGLADGAPGVGATGDGLFFHT